MGTITSFSIQRQKEIEEKKKENNKSRNGKTLLCDFCGTKARQFIVDTKKRRILSCFDCIPPDCKSLPWIKSTEKI